MSTGFKDSAQAGNNYTFHCPVVNRDVRFIVCAFKKHKHWRGERFDAQDCHASMAASKCPAIHMMNKEWKDGERYYFSESMDVHKLPADIGERIEKILIVPYHMSRFDVPVEQRERMLLNEAMDPTKISVKVSRAVRPKKPIAATTGSSLDEGLAQIRIDRSEMLNEALAAAEGEVSHG